MLSLNVSTADICDHKSQIQFPILGKRGKQGYQVDHLGGGQLSTKWSAAHKKETFDL